MESGLTLVPARHWATLQRVDQAFRNNQEDARMEQKVSAVTQISKETSPVLRQILRCLNAVSVRARQFVILKLISFDYMKFTTYKTYFAP